MNREQIIQMARDAGWDEHHINFDTRIERFAAAIRAATKEEDAKICDGEWNGDADTYEYTNACNDCAAAIRASK